MAFNLKVEAIGDVFDVKKNKKEDKDAKLQFINRTDEGSNLIDVKVIGAKYEDLAKFRDKKVKLKDVIISKVDYNTYYKINDISKIELINK